MSLRQEGWSPASLPVHPWIIWFPSLGSLSKAMLRPFSKPQCLLAFCIMQGTCHHPISTCSSH